MRCEVGGVRCEVHNAFQCQQVLQQDGERRRVGRRHRNGCSEPLPSSQRSRLSGSRVVALPHLSRSCHCFCTRNLRHALRTSLTHSLNPNPLPFPSLGMLSRVQTHFLFQRGRRPENRHGDLPGWSSLRCDRARQQAVAAANAFKRTSNRTFQRTHPWTESNYFTNMADLSVAVDTSTRRRSDNEDTHNSTFFFSEFRNTRRVVKSRRRRPHIEAEKVFKSADG